MPYPCISRGAMTPTKLQRPRPTSNLRVGSIFMRFSWRNAWQGWVIDDVQSQGIGMSCIHSSAASSMTREMNDDIEQYSCPVKGATSLRSIFDIWRHSFRFPKMHAVLKQQGILSLPNRGVEYEHENQYIHTHPSSHSVPRHFRDSRSSLTAVLTSSNVRAETAHRACFWAKDTELSSTFAFEIVLGVAAGVIDVAGMWAAGIGSGLGIVGAGARAGAGGGNELNDEGWTVVSVDVVGVSGKFGIEDVPNSAGVEGSSSGISLSLFDDISTRPVGGWGSAGLGVSSSSTDGCCFGTSPSCLSFSSSFSSTLVTGLVAFGSSPALMALMILTAWYLANRIFAATSWSGGPQIWHSSRKVAAAWHASAVCLAELI